MSEKISDLSPKPLWDIFYDLTQIPRPSKSEGKAVQYAREFGEKLGLETIVDDVGNVIIKKSATPGMENRQGVILQSHLDIVPQKNSDTEHDFEKDPIQAYIDGEWVDLDPAFKQHEYIDNIDFQIATGFNSTERGVFLNALKEGATIGSDFIQNLNAASNGTYYSHLLNNSSELKRLDSFEINQFILRLKWKPG